MKRWIQVLTVLAVILPGLFFEGNISVNHEVVGGGITAWAAEAGYETDEFTDTDTRRGTLAVRCDVFQGFRGTVRLVVKGELSEKEIEIWMTEQGGYLANRSLKPERYEILLAEADSDGRKYVCVPEYTEIQIETDQISMCQITVIPEGVYRFPDEEQETEESSGDEKALEEPVKSAEESGPTKEIQEPIAAISENKEPSEGKSKGIPVLVIVSVLGMAGSIWLISQNFRRKDE